MVRKLEQQKEDLLTEIAQIDAKRKADEDEWIKQVQDQVRKDRDFRELEYQWNDRKTKYSQEKEQYILKNNKSSVIEIVLEMQYFYCRLWIHSLQ
jgi:hypothetical protein